MKNFTIKATLASIFLGGIMLADSAVTASAQGNSQWAHEKNRVRKEQKAQERYYRVYRNGSYYQTDYRGASLLRSAVNEGYRQGYRQGQIDRQHSRYTGYRSSITYRGATSGYQSYVDQGQYQYYFRQGFQRGYEDGFNTQSQYGYNSGGKWSILANVLGSILDIRPY